MRFNGPSPLPPSSFDLTLPGGEMAYLSFHSPPTSLLPPSSIYLDWDWMSALSREIRVAKVRDLRHSQEQTKKKRKDETRLWEWVYEWRNALIVMENGTASHKRNAYLRFMHALISISEVIITMGESIEERGSRWLKRSRIIEGRKINDHLGITGMGVGKKILCGRTFALVELKGNLNLNNE